MNTETCYSCKDGKMTIEVHPCGGSKPFKTQIKCIVCDGSASVPAGTKEAHDKFWCKCGNPSGESTHTRSSTDIYTCNDCGRVTQTG